MTDAAAAALMDRIYRRQRHVYDITRKHYLLGRDRLIEGLAPPSGGRVLEIGCGTARNLIAAAHAWPQAKFYGLDISAEMLATAHSRIAAAGHAERICLARADASDFDPALLFGVPSFSRIFLSYSLSMMPDWKGALRQALLWLAPGGELHIIDFGRQERLPILFRAGLRRWLAAFHVTPRDGLEGHLRSLPVEVVKFDRPYRGYAQHAVLLRVFHP